MNKKHERTFIHDAIDFVGLAAQSYGSDDFSDCFRAISPYEMKNSGIFYIFSFIIRYFILLPFRILFMFIGTILIGIYFLYGKYANNYTAIANSFILINKLIIFIANFKIKHYGIKERLNVPHVYVSNHTSFIDYIVLSSYKFSHACIAEGHGGLFGFILINILSKNGSIGFKRSDKQDRSQVLKKIKDHIHDNKAPMLIFPEGTCVNNRHTVLFQKGAFELDSLVCPVALKYNKDLMDPYWNRRLHGFTKHIFYLLTRWRIDAEVHWLTPVSKNENETSIDFSHRVKDMIAEKIQISNTLWNGAFKSSPVLKDREILKNSFIEVYNQIKSHNKKNIDKITDENKYGKICDESKNSKIYFENIKYKDFINQCCKEYLRVKNNKVRDE